MNDVSKLNTLSRTKNIGVSLRLKSWYSFLAPRACSVIVFAALVCLLVTKFFHAARHHLIAQYLFWIFSDVAVLVVIELVLFLFCFRFRSRGGFRTAVFLAAVICTWAVINAGWLIRTGTQIRPAALWTLYRDPHQSLKMVGINIIEMPVIMTILLACSAVAIIFFLSVLVRPRILKHNAAGVKKHVAISAFIIFFAIFASLSLQKSSISKVVSEELSFNCHFHAVSSLIRANSQKNHAPAPSRHILACDEITLTAGAEKISNYNIVIVVLEGIQYRYTSLYNSKNNLTVQLEKLAENAVEFSNTRSVLTHTTKALFGLLTGRYPCASHNLVEAVPGKKPYASLATILKKQLGFRTAFFQSADGAFECRPGLVANLGFEKFFSRDNFEDANDYLGYLAGDEFSMLSAFTEWVGSGQKPFLAVMLCSVSHDPYEVPLWYAQPAEGPLERYKQTIGYTDRFIGAVYSNLSRMKLGRNTIVCVIGDHAEAFGERGVSGHELVVFDEVLKIPFVLKLPQNTHDIQRKITEPVSSIDLTPTLLAFLGFDIAPANFDGINILSDVPSDRNVFFSSWFDAGQAGFVNGRRKYIYSVDSQRLLAYDLGRDPNEMSPIELTEQQQKQIAGKILEWRKSTFFLPSQKKNGSKELFDLWLCKWKNLRGASTLFRQK